MKETLVIRGKIKELATPWVMGILNVTPDSFYGASRVAGAAEAAKRAAQMTADGADIIDIGACSTRPGAAAVTSHEELRRLEGPLDAIRAALPDAILSVDTFYASTAAAAIDRWNVEVINDVSGGADPEMFAAVAERGVAYVLTHTRGTPADMDSRAVYSDVTAEVLSELAFRLDAARDAGLCNVIVDPGFGFAKTVRQNYILLAGLGSLKVLGCPVLAGLSRKRMARAACPPGASDGEVLAATVALNAIAVEKGASIIRVHDVKEGVAAARAAGAINDLKWISG